MPIVAVTDKGVLQSVSEGLTLRFTAPADATDVVISVYEVNSWSVNGQTVAESSRPRRLCAEIFGTLQASTFTRTKINTYLMMQNGSATTFMNMPITIDGTTSHVPLQNVGGERERGFFEVQFAYRCSSK